MNDEIKSMTEEFLPENVISLDGRCPEGESGENIKAGVTGTETADTENGCGNEVENDVFSDRERLDKIKSTVEAVLFAAGYPVRYDKLASVLEITPGQAKKIVLEYADEYNGFSPDAPGAIPRGVLLLAFDDACQLCTKEEYGASIREALGIRRGGNLSASSIEVLAIIAYNEPVTRAFVDTVRGVDSSYAVTSLAEKHLIEPCGRLDAPGRPVLYRTTDDFLRVFGMTSLGDLPEVCVTPEGERQESLPYDEAAEADEETGSEADDGSKYDEDSDLL